jgi:eukaryotic-like serine/threonine-protein kinase
MLDLLPGRRGFEAIETPMGTTPEYSRIVSFGLFDADLERGELRKSGVRIKLHGQPFQILTLLLERPGEVVTREEIREKLWPGNTFVEFDNGLNVAVKKLRTALSDDADNARFVETVPKRGYRLVVPVSRVVSSATPSTVAAPVGPEIRDREAVGPAPVLPERAAAAQTARQGFGRRKFVLALLLMLVALAGIAAYRWRGSLAIRAAAGSNSGARIIPRRSVAVLGFRNLPGRPEEDWLSVAFSEMLSTELAAGGGLRLVNGEDISRAKHDLHIADADTLAKSTLANLRINPGADVVVLGSCTPMTERGLKRIRVDIRLQDTHSGETIAEEAFTGDEESLFDVASRAGAHLRDRLGANAVSVEAMNAARASLPSNQQATRLYAEGRAKLYEFEFLEARDLLVKAVAADPGNAATHAALADAWEGMGYAVTAQEEGKRALDLSSALSREEQLSIEGRYRELIWDWSKAIELYRALTQFYPDNLEYGLRLASVLSKAGRGAESLQAIAAVRRIPKPISDDPRIDLQEAIAFENGADYQHMLSASANAAAKAQERGSRGLLAEARLQQSLAANRLNDPKGAIALTEEAQSIYKQAGDNYGVARARFRMADDLFQQGKFAESNAVLENCLQVFRSLGNDGYVAQTLNDIAGGLFEMGEMSKARSMFEEALAQQRLVRNKRGSADALTNLGALLQQQGDLGVARKYDEEALALYTELGEKGDAAFVQGNIGSILLDLGELSASKNLYTQSLALQRELGNESAVAEYMQDIANSIGEQGDVAGAQKLYDDALAIQVNRGEQGNAAETRLSKAELMVEAGNAADAEPLVRSAVEQFKKENQVSHEVSAHDTLAEILLDLGRLAEARAEVGQATKLAGRNQLRMIRLKTEIIAARVLSADGNRNGAAKQVRTAMNEAREYGLFARQLEATLALAEINARSGKKTESIALLKSVEKDARSKGFVLIARKAAANRG